MYKYEMDPTRMVGTREQTRESGRTDGWRDGRTDRWMDGVKPIYPQQLRCVLGISVGGIIKGVSRNTGWY